jgi:hypothetical protein
MNDGPYGRKVGILARASSILLRVLVAAIACPLICGFLIGSHISGSSFWLFTHEGALWIGIVLMIGVFAGRPLSKQTPRASVVQLEMYEVVRHLVQNGRRTSSVLWNGRIVRLRLAHKGNTVSIVFPEGKASARSNNSGVYTAFTVQSDGTVRKFAVTLWHPHPMPLDDSTTWKRVNFSSYEVNRLRGVLALDVPKLLATT